SPRGVLLFVDEAEAFLAQRRHGNFHLRAAVSFFLTETGSSSTRLQLILATNRFEDLDEAVLSRLPFKIKFGAPSAELLQQQFDDRAGRLAAPAAERLRQLLGQRGEGQPHGLQLEGLGFTGRDVQSLFEEFGRRWSLEKASGGKRKADQDWLDRWLQYR
ncbi:Atad3, partial [Symbiodinium natans]